MTIDNASNNNMLHEGIREVLAILDLLNGLSMEYIPCMAYVI